jgi:histidinol-phosphate phosphatase family protein
VFLDRDGVIVRSRRDYVKSWAEVEVLDGALEAIARLCRAGHRVMVVTNQSAVGRGVLSSPELDVIHLRLSLLAHRKGGRISRYFVCPHAPGDCCGCRKPRPGLLLRTRSEMSADRGGAFVVGDQLSDVEAAWSVGSRAVLVLSGETDTPPHEGCGEDLLAPDLSGAADLILASTGR